MEYVTYKAMEHIRIAHGKAYFPIVDTNETCNHLRDLEVDTHNILMPAEIKRLIDDMLIHQEIAFDADQDKLFSFVKNNQSHGRLLYTNITYWPMKNPQEYYEDFFLDSSDRILKFKSRNLGNRSGKTEAHVLIKLGLDKIPPRKSTVGHMKDYLIRTSQTKNLAAAIVAKLEKSLRDFENVNPREDNPAMKRARTGTERTLNKFQQLVKYRNNAIRELDNKPDHMPCNDRYDMTSKVLFNMQYGQT
ncbi:hypothetical protein METBIDRAFT_11509 [Metschnikowia bicuspidata var. bicuspidata NRRL YB-4993]|uniref:Uncharacterized protein n=1 Tax=Metschnikowia bicuspidata var. bicuspidata NRRL YB-4993 TaxID=869754 RepID=A0A1A0H9U9_9ASCO|nr:hypothetical protein METBIDRAFT_11509 [Metschnikowia bicuspidata var. bicuspidata NRRL YB-4993]OBA20904.1 hypothetical protein METBIDRAFT_11509 [Metschnikowia bicuspidata var. bicuspidata NRRL YB-4993]